MLWIVSIQVEAVITKCPEVDVSAGRMELKKTESRRLGSNRSVVTRWSRPIRPTLAAGVWQGSEARRAGARPGMHTKAGGKERCVRHSARASTYGQAVL